MNKLITVTSKGQITLPAALRRNLGVIKGGKIYIDFSENGTTATIERPLTLDEITAKYSKLVKSDTRPLLNASEFYQTRKPRI